MSSNEEIKKQIFKLIKSLIEDKTINISENTGLLSENGLLDSMKLVELCLLLEDMALDIGFEFDWTSDAAMSKSRSMFRSAGTLITEFINQMDIKK